MENARVAFNVSGVRYETLESTLQRFPDTLLGSRTKRNSLQKSAGVIVLYCSASMFDAILFYYQSDGILVRPPSSPTMDFEQVCRYFLIPEHDIRKMIERDGLVVGDDILTFEFGSRTQQLVWQFIENPQSSKAARLYAFIVYGLIFLSVLIGCFHTSSMLRSYLWLKEGLFTFDFALNFFFMLELLTRFFTFPEKIYFLSSGVNVIDTLTIVPSLAMEILTVVGNSSVVFLYPIQTLRVLRLLRVQRQSKRLRVVFRILSDCIIDVVTMMLAVALSSLIYASVVFYAEQSASVATQFTSIPESLWWAMQTIIPLGYGDIIPRSIFGKIAGGIVCVLAAFSFTVPVLFLGGKFLLLYSRSFDMALGNDFKSIGNDDR